MVLSWDMGPHRPCPAVYTGLKNIQSGWFHQVRSMGNCSLLVWQKSKRRTGTPGQGLCPACPVSTAPCPAFIAYGSSVFSILSSLWGPPCPPFSCSFLYILIFLVCKSGLVSAPKITWVVSRPISLCLWKWLSWWSSVPRVVVTQLWWMLAKGFLTGGSGKPFLTLDVECWWISSCLIVLGTISSLVHMGPFSYLSVCFLFCLSSLSPLSPRTPHHRRLFQCV